MMEYDVLDSKTAESGNLELNNGGKRSLKQCRGWAWFLAILGFIGTGFVLLAAIIMFAFGGRMAEGSGFHGGWLGLLYLAILALNIMPLIFLAKFAHKAGLACTQNDNGAFNEAIKNLGALFKSLGIVTIIFIVLYIIAIIIMVVFGMSELLRGSL